MAIINGVDVDKMKKTQSEIKKDISLTERQPTIEAKWLDGSKAQVKLGDVTSNIGGDGNLNAMQTLLASLAACDIDLIATHAALAGIKIDELSIVTTGHFNSRAYYDIEDAAGPGYDRIDYVVHIKAPGITSEQLKHLEEICGRASPVGDSLTKQIPLHISFKTE